MLIITLMYTVKTKGTFQYFERKYVISSGFYASPNNDVTKYQHQVKFLLKLFKSVRVGCMHFKETMRFIRTL